MIFSEGWLLSAVPSRRDQMTMPTTATAASKAARPTRLLPSRPAMRVKSTHGIKLMNMDFDFISASFLDFGWADGLSMFAVGANGPDALTNTFLASHQVNWSRSRQNGGAHPEALTTG